MATIAARLKSERKRLALTQAEMAKRCGISREIWCRYEQGNGLPGSEVLQAFLKAGGNVHFVLLDGVHQPDRLNALEDQYLEVVA